MEEINKIKFGTDGWRGIIAKDFTFSNIRIASQAVSDYINSELYDSKYAKSVIIGYDNRFLSEKFASEVARVIMANNIEAKVSKTAVTSPSISLFCKENNCLGIMITASHNPPIWNGLKVKLQYGSSVSQEVINKISDFLYKNSVNTGNKEIIFVDVLNSYKKYLKSMVSIKSLLKLKIVIDSMNGSGAGIYESFFKKEKIYSVRNYRDPMFSGVNPEPIEKNLNELKKEILKNNADVGFAFDGDADRLGVIDDRGRYLPPHIVFPLILLYLIEGRKLKGNIVQTISLGYISERIAKKYSIPLEEVSVGFKYVCEKMLIKDVLLGGEESGGYGWKGGIPERDGILNALLLTEMLIKTKKKLSFLVDDMQKKFGKSCYMRKDIKLKQPVDKEKFTNKVKEIISKEKNIKEIRAYDGIKIVFDNDSWLLLRPSGTEPVLRTYSETESVNNTKKLLDFAEEICLNLL
ncbi:MAG: hypothetical protein A2539_10015 [Elusimicrobia bacterium RIFOXYD2_FULL_34_15]|nr:MAG: hypothetical protein A2539_10015 [Elusimicrobia bacterium RIFOXYD2_FULL_34_15]